MIESIVIFTISIIFLSIFPKIAKRYNLIDKPIARSLHTIPTPRGAGMIFAPSIIIGYILYSPNDIKEETFILISLSIIWITGLIDDFKRLSPKVKFISIAIAVSIIYIGGFKIDTISNFASGTIYLGVLSFPFTYFAVAGFTNAFNLIDGLDALASLVALVISILFAILGYIHNDSILLYTSISLISALLAFLVYNKPKAKLFMGDSGSLSLGFILSILFIEAIKYIDAVSVLYIGALPITDTLVSILRRSRDNYSLISADKCHLHHIALYITKSPYKSLFILLLYQLIMMSIGYICSFKIDSAYMLLLYLIHILVIYYYIMKLKSRFNLNCYPSQK